MNRNKSKISGIKEQPNIPKTKNSKVTEDLDQILIVDDNIFNLQTLQTMIKLKFKQPSVIASSGEIALEFVNKRIKENKPPFKLVFMDCSMPIMDGFQATRAILDIC